MLNQIVNRLQGQVRVRVESGFPERVINLCSARNLAFWDLRWESPGVFTCTLSRRDYYRLRRAAKKLECTLRVEKKEGVPFFLGRFRHRQVLLAGLTLCGCAMLLGSFFIWDFRIEGNVTVPDEEILRALERNGIGIGTYGFSVDGEDLRNHILLEIPELSWIAVNVSGCRAYVQVRERIPAPELADNSSPTNLVARRAGVVLEVEALAGEKLVLPGTTVEEGQILISGVSDSDTVGALLSPGMGSVWARTWYQLETRISLTDSRKVYTGKEKKGLSLIFGTHRIKFYGNPSQSGENYDKITQKTRLSLFGLPLPITVETETYRFYETEQTALDPVAAEARGEELLTAYLHTLLDEDGEVRSTLCASQQSGDVLTVTLTAECREQIGVSVPVYTETDETAEREAHSAGNGS